MWKDFKAFIFRGNIFDMAVGVIIGGAFGKIVTSLVNDILMPLIGIISGGVNFTSLKYVIKPEVVDEAGAVVTKESAVLYGNFIQQTVDFLIIAASIFLMLRAATMVSKKLSAEKKAEEEKAAEPPAPPAPPAPTAEELLTEIRDLLKKDN